MIVAASCIPCSHLLNALGSHIQCLKTEFSQHVPIFNQHHYFTNSKNNPKTLTLFTYFKKISCYVALASLASSQTLIPSASASNMLTLQACSSISVKNLVLI